MNNKFRKIAFTMLTFSALFLLSGCTNDSEKVVDGKVEFHKSVKDSVAVNTEKLEDEYIVYVYPPLNDCFECKESTNIINDYVKNIKGDLPVYAFDFSDEKNTDTLDYFVSKGFMFVGKPTFGYFYKGELYKNESEIKEVGILPTKDDYKNLKKIEFELVDEYDIEEGHSSEDGHNHNH